MMHQKVPTLDDRAIIWADYAAFEDGWTDAERCEPCLPPRDYSLHRQKLYVRGWSLKRSDMLRAG